MPGCATQHQLLRADCGKAWGRGEDKLCNSRNFMHRILGLTQENCLWHGRILRSFTRGSRERRPLDQEPQAHLAVGRQRKSREVAQPAVKGGLSGRCGRRVTARARIEAGGSLPCPDHKATLAASPDSCCGAGPGAHPPGCVLRLAVGAMQGLRPGRIRNRVRAGEKAASRPDAASDGGSPSARRAKGSRQRLLERRQHRPRGRSGASRLLRRC